MFGFPQGALIFVALTIAVGLLLLAVAGTLPKLTRTVTRVFWCPFRSTDATVEFQEDPFGHGRYLDVKSCTAFQPPAPITCGKLCRYLRNFPAARNVQRGDA